MFVQVPTLQLLDLSGNDLSDRELEAFLDASGGGACGVVPGGEGGKTLGAFGRLRPLTGLSCAPPPPTSLPHPSRQARTLHNHNPTPTNTPF